MPYDPHRVIKTVSGEAYIRIADKKIKLKPDEIYHLSTDRGQIDVEQESLDLAYPDDLDWAALTQYVNAVKKAHELDEARARLRNFGVPTPRQKKGGPVSSNLACALLFAKDPLAFLPGCRIRFLRYEGEHEGTGESLNVIKDQDVTGTVPEIIAKTEAILDSQLRTFSKLGKDGKFYTAPEYPKMAWYEAIVNACVHRSYALKTMSIFVKMFDDRLEVESPGGFPPLVSPQNIYDMSNW